VSRHGLQHPPTVGKVGETALQAGRSQNPPGSDQKSSCDLHTCVEEGAPVILECRRLRFYRALDLTQTQSTKTRTRQDDN
jgi:hypothetical protein